MLHIGPSFGDVAMNVFYYRLVETLLHWGVTGGCTATTYCPTHKVMRAQVAIFIVQSVLGGGPPAVGSGPNRSWNCIDGQPNHFTDVPDMAGYCRHVHCAGERHHGRVHGNAVLLQQSDGPGPNGGVPGPFQTVTLWTVKLGEEMSPEICLLYTSDAADE